MTEKKGNTVKIRNAYGNEHVQNVVDVFGKGLILCVKCQSVLGKTRLATISMTRQVLVTRKNQEKSRIKDFREQRDTGECQHT